MQQLASLGMQDEEAVEQGVFFHDPVLAVPSIQPFTHEPTVNRS